MTTNPNDCAFPWFPDHDKPDPCLTKREYFAAKALQGLCANSERTGSYENYAHDSVKHADHLIAELNEPEDPMADTFFVWGLQVWAPSQHRWVWAGRWESADGASYYGLITSMSRVEIEKVQSYFCDTKNHPHLRRNGVTHTRIRLIPLPEVDSKPPRECPDAKEVL